MTKHREYPMALKQAAVSRVAAGESVAEVARDLKLRGRLLYARRNQVRAGGPAALRGRGRPRKRATAVADPAAAAAGEGELAQRRGRAGAQDRPAAGRPRFFSASLAACEGEGVSQRRAWRRAVYEVIQTMTSSLPQGQVTIERLCRLARVSRAGYYRLWQASAPREHDTAVRDAIQRLVLATGRYRRGYRYITRQLRHDGLIVNHTRVLRLMREDNLLGLRRRPFVPPTTDARHRWPVVPNLARDMQLSALDQLWVADITPAFAGAGSIPGSRRSSPIWRLSSMRSAAASSAGRWPIIWAPAWRWRRPGAAWSTIPTAACSTPVPSTPACSTGT